MNTITTAVLMTACLLPAVKGADEPRFEAASVRRTDQCGVHNSVDPGRIELSGVPLKAVLREAFTVAMDDIVGPSWLETDCFSISVKIPEGVAKDRLPAMWRALLVDRFQLSTHMETRQRPGYVLLVDKAGSKLKASEVSTNAVGARAGQVRFGSTMVSSGIKGSMTTASLAGFLSRRLDGPVRDLTGLTGKYDIDITWAPDRTVEKVGAFAQYQAMRLSAEEIEASLPAGTGNLFEVVRETLGLRLESRKSSVEVVVIDHVERIPTEN